MEDTIPEPNRNCFHLNASHLNLLDDPLADSTHLELSMEEAPDVSFHTSLYSESSDRPISIARLQAPLLPLQHSVQSLQVSSHEVYHRSNLLSELSSLEVYHWSDLSSEVSSLHVYHQSDESSQSMSMPSLDIDPPSDQSSLAVSDLPSFVVPEHPSGSAMDDSLPDGAVAAEPAVASYTVVESGTNQLQRKLFDREG